MKKFFPVLLGLMLPLASAMADNFVDEAVSFCRSRGGAYTMADMAAEGDNYCRQVTCRRTTSDRFEIPAGAPGPEANVEATKGLPKARKSRPAAECGEDIEQAGRGPHAVRQT